MVSFLPASLAPPVSPLPERAELARAFAVVGLWVLVAGFVSALLVAWLAPDLPVIIPLGLTTMGIGALVGLRLNHLGHTRTASWVLLLAGMTTITVVAFRVDGVDAPMVELLPLAILVGGLLLGTRAAGLLAALSGGIVAALVLAEHVGQIVPSHRNYNPYAMGVVRALYFLIAWVAIGLIARVTKASLAQAGRSIREVETMARRLDLALDAGHIGAWEYDLTGHTLRMGPRAIRLLNLTSTPWEPVPLLDVLTHVDKRDADQVRAQMQSLPGTESARALYFRVRASGGGVAERRLLLSGQFVPAGMDCGPRLVGVVRDATDEFRASEERARLLLDLTERMKELRLLHSATSLLAEGPPTSERLQRLVALIPSAWMYPERCGARITVGTTEVTSGGILPTPIRQTTTFRAAGLDGAVEVWYGGEGLPLTADGTPFLKEEAVLLQSVADLLARAIETHAEQERSGELESQLRQSQKMEALGTLAGGIAHDFNNILASISGNARIALEDAGDGPVRAYLEEIVTGARRATDLVKRILMFSRTSAGSRLAAVSIRQSVEDALTVVKAGLTPTVSLNVEFAPDLPLAMADAGQIHQVVMNLGGNAAYAMRETGGFLQVTVQPVLLDEHTRPTPEIAPGRYVCITVRDTGLGIPPEVRERIFEPFFTTKGVHGTGLGLSVVYGIVRDHHGAITVDSTPGVGTEFRVYIPAAEASAVAVAAATPEQGQIHRGQGQHILYVDDEEALALLISRVLTRMGYRCTALSDPQQAVETFCADPSAFDAVITDLAMPELDGASVLRAIFAVRPDIPAAVTSGFGDAAAEEAMQGLQVPRLAKPASPEAISAVLHELLSRGAGGGPSQTARP